ncbi:CAMK/CAMKL/AMPK protein kinase Ppk9 [Schizosaccharomyces japonicus yFS275]|uniref:CAMK/CAMKL/AMPK protein kinase Ppk9 n=1 Tax=Schizosaccharomyces japonicus (strain yFS275 / FY16936) TaxID=402676 RepID=B6JVE8_SCHJY|nr:CAMK/CAMKL/AMPK protein kinase Ppk9 [Schizosaccharomyces japonicus yFS275]EEB05349.2 CAMK/CAMKL/AMPK protein kinase Ppk9 [Schizosaccharomyces japonicus yFS275]
MQEPVTAAAASELTPDVQCVGPWQLGRTLGRGSFCKVKLGVHCETHQRAALKMISKADLMDPVLHTRMLREVYFLRHLHHPNIIGLYQVLSTSQHVVLALEFMEMDLHSLLITRKKLNDDDARTIFRQIVFAIDYCHAHSVAHRDLKLENILLNKDLHVKLTDFGLSNVMQDGTFLTTACGTPHYAAPEVIQGRYYDGSDVDVWGCGILLYVMLVGSFPFEDLMITNVLSRVCKGQYDIPSYVSRGAADLIRQMLVVLPTHRIRVAGIVQHPWFLGTTVCGRPRARTISASARSKANSMDIPSELTTEAPMRIPSVSAFPSPSLRPTTQTTYSTQYLRSPSPLPLASPNVTGSPESRAQSSWNSLHLPDAFGVSSWHSDIGDSLCGDSDESLPESTIRLLPTSIPIEHARLMEERCPEKQFRRLSTTGRIRPLRWHYGIRSERPPLDLLSRLYSALREMGGQFRLPEKDGRLRGNIYRIDCLLTNERTPVNLIIELFSLGAASVLDIRFKRTNRSTITSHSHSEPILIEGRRSDSTDLKSPTTAVNSGVNDETVCSPMLFLGVVDELIKKIR